MASDYTILALLGEGGYAGRALLGVMQYARERPGWSVRVFRRAFEGASDIQRLGAAGIVGQFAGSRPIAQMAGVTVPIVNISRATETPFPLVGMDNRAIGRMAAEHFIERGYSRLICLTANPLYATERVEGFRQAAEAAGVTCEVAFLEHVADRKIGILEFERQLAAWLAKLPQRSALFTAHWTGETFGSILQLAGVRVPEDLAILTVGDSPASCEREDPPISSVDYPAERIGYEAAALLADLIQGGQRPRSPILLPPTVVTERASTNTVAVADSDVLLAVEYIKKNACRDFDFRLLEKEILISRRTLERRFKQFLGRTLQEEVMRVQMEQAKYLLAQTDMPLDQVARRAGMKRASRLCNIFKERFGVTPRQYRLQGRPMG